jgi:DNA-binding transcriptional MerR regulator
VSVFLGYLQASDAARRLGISPKALRLYEQRGLLTPVRTEAGWRAYGTAEMARASEIVALRAIGLSLAQVADVLEGDARALEPALAAHQADLQVRIARLGATVEQIRRVRSQLADGHAPAGGELSGLLNCPGEIEVAFDLPWPWGGERFELHGISRLTYIIGPLGSGKTRLAQRLAETLPGAVFLGLDRLADDGTAARAQLEADAALKLRVDKALSWLVEDGATPCPALVTLFVGLEATGPTFVVVDMIEEGLDQVTQMAVVAHLRHHRAGRPPLFVMTRSSAILDLAAVGADEAIILCPANHSPPTLVAAIPGAVGYEAVGTCLASPDVRARTAGVIAWRGKREA